MLQHFQVVNLWTQDRIKSDIWSVPEFEQYLAAQTGSGAAFAAFWDQVQTVTSEAAVHQWSSGSDSSASHFSLCLCPVKTAKASASSPVACCLLRG